MHKLRNEILFLQLEDSNYMLGKIECMQTVTYAKLTLCTMFLVWSGRIPEKAFSTFDNVFHHSKLLRTFWIFASSP